jgi:hypothetical protein
MPFESMAVCAPHRTAPSLSTNLHRTAPHRTNLPMPGPIGGIFLARSGVGLEDESDNESEDEQDFFETNSDVLMLMMTRAISALLAGGQSGKHLS